jgi:ribonuclease R
MKMSNELRARKRKPSPDPDPSSARENIIAQTQIPTVWPEGVAEALEQVSDKACKVHQEAVVDLTAVPFVTIDGKDARDFDDAVFCSRANGGFRLDVAIADVSRWVTRDDPLDGAARERGNSVYFPGHVVPMLPELLSNNLCSLKPGKVRFALVCRMQISNSGKIQGYEFLEATIRSAARLDYEGVSGFLEVADDKTYDKLPAVRDSLLTLDAVTLRLFEQRRSHGGVNMEFPETRICYDPKGWIRSIASSSRLEAARLIEECMLAANVCAAETLDRHLPEAIYRCHESPHPDSVRTLREVYAMFGVKIAGGSQPTGLSFSRALESAKKRDTPLTSLQILMLRCMKQAHYSPLRKPHFALGFDAYTHFTSPIRRYPDLIVHRLLKALLAGGELPPPEYEASELGVIAEHCSHTERRAETAERELATWLKAGFMRSHIGKTFGGTVSGVTGFGVFVTLDDFPVEGMVHVSELGNHFYEFDERQVMLVARDSSERIGLGDSMTIRVAGVQLEEGKIDLTRVLNGGKAKHSAKGRKRKSGYLPGVKGRRRSSGRRQA